MAEINGHRRNMLSTETLELGAPLTTQVKRSKVRQRRSCAPAAAGSTPPPFTMEKTRQLARRSLPHVRSSRSHRPSRHPRGSLARRRPLVARPAGGAFALCGGASRVATVAARGRIGPPVPRCRPRVSRATHGPSAVPPAASRSDRGFPSIRCGPYAPSSFPAIPLPTQIKS